MNVEAAVRRGAEALAVLAFKERSVRIAYSEKRLSSEFGPRLVPAYVLPVNATRNVHNYPLSIAGWALVEGTPIAWPQDRNRKCDFERVAELGKLAEVDRLVSDDRLLNAPPYLARAVDTDVVQARFRERTLTVGAFYQDWVSWSPALRYSQFVSVPVPFSGSVPSSEFGVYNIDSFDEVPLLDEATMRILRDVTEQVASAYRNH